MGPTLQHVLLRFHSPVRGINFYWLLAAAHAAVLERPISPNLRLLFYPNRFALKPQHFSQAFQYIPDPFCRFSPPANSIFPPDITLFLCAKIVWPKVTNQKVHPSSVAIRFSAKLRSLRGTDNRGENGVRESK
jgi:hypothetical protein